MKNIAFIIFLLFISICRAQDNNILFQNYNVSNGLSQNTVIRSLEDSNGVMWFCTRDGLNRFDGTEFEVFRADGQPHSLSSSDVTTIIEESPGVLWIGTHSGLNRYDVSSNTFTQYFHDPANQYTISDNCIKHLLCDNQKKNLGRQHEKDSICIIRKLMILSPFQPTVLSSGLCKNSQK